MYLKLITLLATFAAMSAAAPIYYLATDQTGAQTQIDVAHTSTWVMTPNTTFDFAGGLLTMKAGGSATVVVTFSLYEGADNTGSLIGSVILTNAGFCGQVSNCSKFETHQFLFLSPIELTSGTTYFAALTSLAVDTQSQAYFIKDSTSFVSDVFLAPITPEPVDFGVPEPGTIALMAIGLALLYRHRPGSRPGAEA
jgi:hypothetical protein